MKFILKWRSRNNWDIASHSDMIVPFPWYDPDCLALDWWWQLVGHYSISIWVSRVDLRLAFGPSPIRTIIWNLELERFYPLISIPSSSSLNLGNKHDVLECELMPLILITSFRNPSLPSIPCIVELTAQYSANIIISWRSRTGGFNGSPHYEGPIV
jgi:hypothetical protein